MRVGELVLGDEVRQAGEHGGPEERVRDARDAASTMIAAGVSTNGSATNTREPDEVGVDDQPLAREPVDERRRRASPTTTDGRNVTMKSSSPTRASACAASMSTVRAIVAIHVPRPEPSVATKSRRKCRAPQDARADD